MQPENLETQPSLTRNATWLLAAKAIAFAATLVLPLLVVRRLSPYNVGLYQQVFLIINSAVTLLPLGFYMSAYYFLPREPERRGTIVLNICLYSAAVGGASWLVLAVWPTLLVRILNGATLAGYAPLAGLAIATLMMGTCLEPLSVAGQDMRLATAFIVGSSVSRGSLMLAAVLVFGTVRSLVWAIAIHGLAQTVALLLYLEAKYPGFWRQFDARLLRRQLGYALPLALAGVLWTLQTDLHNYFVSHQLGTLAFAIYSYGTFELPLTGILSEAAASVLIPRVSLLEKHGDHRQIIELIASAARKLAGVYFPMFAMLAVLARVFIVTLFTERYAAATPIFLVNICLLPLNVLLVDPVMRAYTEFHATLVRIRIALFIVLCVSLWLGVARYGAIGAIGSVVLIGAFERGLRAALRCRLVGVRGRDIRLRADLGKLAIASAVAAGATWVVRQALSGRKPIEVLIAGGAVFTAVYVAGVLTLRIPRPEEWDIARRWAGAARARVGLLR